jgi:diguanylate cyclase (GGDEF)-like protein
MTPRPFTILIVSSDRMTLRRLSKFLEVFGYEVRQATDQSQALAAAELDRPDFLIVDAAAASAAELQVCRTIRRLWTPGYTYALLLAPKLEVAGITAALEQGFDDFLAAPIVFGEVLARLRAGARVVEFERRLAEQASADSVTGLAGKAALAAELLRRSQSAKGAIGWLAFIDLDYFHRIAARLGRTQSQNLLRELAKRLQSRCTPESFVASLGEDRFAVLLPTSDSAAASTWCQQALVAIAQEPFVIGSESHHLTGSCGLTEVTTGETLDEVQIRAQRALQLAKSSGRSCVITSDEVDRDADDWAALAAGGKLFQTTLARDVMHPCPVILHLDETLDQAHALLSLTGLAHAPVVDAEGKLAGILSLDRLAAARLRNPKPRGHGSNSSSVRLVRHVMDSDVTRFDESTPFAELLEYFTGESATLAVVVHRGQPRGILHCQAIAALNERLTADHFASPKPRTGDSSDLLVPDLAIAE